MNIFDLWDFGDPVASEERFRDAADDAANDEEEGMALTQLARAQGLQGKFDDARESLAHAKRLIGDDGSAAGAQYLLELGRVENSSGNPAAAMPHFAEALRLAQGLGAEYAAGDAAHMLAIAAPPELQTKYAEEALAIVRASGDERARRWIGPIVNNLGWSYMDAGNPEAALSYFQESLEFRLTQGLDAPVRIARYALGCALRACGRLDEAWAVQKEALAMGGSVGYIEEEIAECLFGLGRVDEAKPFFREAHEKLSSQTDLAKSDPERLARLLALA